MDALTAFGLFAVTLMLVTHALEHRHPAWILAFARFRSSHRSLLQGMANFGIGTLAPFGVVEAIWSAVALRRWSQRLKTTQGVT